jgi:hypothetical protein
MLRRALSARRDDKSSALMSKITKLQLYMNKLKDNIEISESEDNSYESSA